MPPTPFHPTHETPFKSSISSSQQARKRNELARDLQEEDDATTWPSSFPPTLLDSRHWTYLAEGGKNLLLRYEGPFRMPFVHSSGRRVALRLSKIIRGGKDDNAGPNIDPLAWREKILQQDLADAVASPSLHRCQEDDNESISSFLRQVATKIETQRPLERRKTTGIDETCKEGLYITEDLSASIEGKTILSIEIKPKCGFMPSSSIRLSAKTAQVKTICSRYRMHRVLKGKGESTLAEFEEWYDPLDLYSGDRHRVRKASQALINDWKSGEGNLRVFLDGKRIDADEIEKLDSVNVDGTDHHSFEETLYHLLSSRDTQALLARLLQLQAKYDSLDVEGVAALYEEEKGKALSEADEPEPTLEEYEAARENETDNMDHRKAIVRLLLSAMYKDCSLFIRCISGEPLQHYLVDLDPKPITKLAYFKQIDSDICDNFTTWAKQVGLL